MSEILGKNSELLHSDTGDLHSAELALKHACDAIENQLQKTIAKLTKYDPTAADEINNSLATFKNQRQQVEIQLKKIDESRNIKSILSFARDITHRKLAEEKLHLHQQEFTTLIDNSPDITARFDKQMRHIYVNKAVQLVTGMPVSAFIGKTNRELGMPESLCDFWDEKIQNVFRTGQQQTVQFDLLTPSSKQYYDSRLVPEFTTDGSVESVLAIARDISVHKRQEAELKQLNETLEAQVAQRTAELETFFDALPDYIFVVDRENMRMPFVNDCFAKAIGFENRQQIQGKTIFECFPPEIASRFAEQNLQVFASGETLHFQETITLPIGTIHFDTFKIPLKKPNGEVYALIGTARNITELIDTKQALSKRTQELEIVNKELESFSYSVSHDLRAPLRHISGFEDALRKQLELSDALSDTKIVRYLELIHNSSKKMGLLIDGMLALSRLGRRELMQVPVNLKLLAETAFNLALPQIPTDEDRVIEFEVKEMPAAIADEALLQQVFTNLIANAVKFSRDRNPARITVGSVSDGTIFVKDNGVGFDMKYASQLFGSFQRLHSQQDFEGTGIGLAIARRIIHRHGGKIWAFSELDQGATFYFKLLTVNG